MLCLDCNVLYHGFFQVLAVTVKFILKDAEERKASFNPRPYFRLFINWLLDLCSLDPVFDGANFQVLLNLTVVNLLAVLLKK